jgi:hypothetical protein
MWWRMRCWSMGRGRIAIQMLRRGAVIAGGGNSIWSSRNEAVTEIWIGKFAGTRIISGIPLRSVVKMAGPQWLSEDSGLRMRMGRRIRMIDVLWYPGSGTR